MCFITKIFSGKKDEFVHLQFQKFSRGEFKNRAIINAKKTGGKYTIKTGPEFANEMVKIVASSLEDKRAEVTGAIISTNDLKEVLEFKEIKQFQGVKKYMINKEMSGNEILNLLEKFPKAFFALSFKTDKFILKIKPKAPKSGKPGKSEEAPKADFCTFITMDKKIAEEFIFEVPDFNKAEVNHTFFIDEIVIPEELKKEKDYSIIREKSLRKGKILRVAIIDGKTIKKEANFEA